MRVALLLPVALLAAACSTDSPAGSADDTGSNGGDALPLLTGSYAGTYKVPTAPPLEAAATFTVDRVRWELTGSTIELDYDLPVGLVGGSVRVRLAGTVATGATTVDLAGDLGTGTCTATGAVVTCREDLAGIGTMPISSEIVAQHAANEYAGPASDRIQVANVFGSDPIGFVGFDTSASAD
ncbi:MAG TPA: hypothetical protein VGM90_05495 [Kofleriaceae bacterium]|jgi:hypothetical protein